VQTPETRYARSGDVSIAYQVVGDGPFDVVLMTAFSHVELAWSHPLHHGEVPRRLSEFARLIFLDRRGMGMSDRVTGESLETRMDDIRAVMDAAGSRRAALFGMAEGGAISLVFAATYPERTSALVLFATLPRTMWAADYPWGLTEEQASAMRKIFMQLFFGSRQEALEVARLWRGPGLGDDELFEDIDYLRRAAGSPRTMEAYQALLREIDVRQVLPGIRAPTLLIHGAEASPFSVDGARYMARQIPAARLLELPGAPMLPAGADLRRALDEAEAFLKDAWEGGAWDEPEPDCVLATVMFTDIVDSSARAVELGDRAWRETLQRHHELVRRQLVRFRGREIDNAGDGFLASFDGPARAIRCAQAVVEGVHALGLEVRAGLHTGECELLDGKVAGIAVHTGARVASHAEPGEVLVSSTVKDLVAGSGLAFQDRGAHELKGVPGEWRLFAVEQN
jgi:pimeloyl-ACP methyl ester carboxylesterase